MIKVSEATRKTMEAYSKAEAAYKANPTPENLEILRKAIRANCPWLNDAEDSTAADTFRDHNPVDQILYDYEVWDRHHG